MKKYLMIGAAILALASCTKNDFETMSQEEITRAQDKANYEKAFVNYIGGNVASNQDWGFNSRLSVNASKAITRGHYADANMWGATYKNVPSVLTPAQKLRVQKYFQYNNQPEGISVNYKDFFVQDVYKGNKDPLNDGETEALSQYSTEKYTFGDNQEAGSAHMDKLTAGSDNDHINNYNNATCSVNDNVWDGTLIPQTHYENGTPIDFNDRKVYHSDAIMLMVDSKSDCFGWHETNGSIQHNDKYVIISAAEIDRWADANKDVIDDNLGDPVTDKFNRNFVGFDYEAQVDLTDLYAFPDGWDTYEDLGNGTWEPVHHDGIRCNESGVPYLKNNTNQYAHRVVPAGTEGAYPVWERDYWVIPGCADGYYSDWIVCIVEGIKRTSDEPVYDLRIIAEDLSATQASDFDFNDVVIDVKYGAAGEAELLLVAAGGTLPLVVGGQLVENKVIGGTEVHGLWGEQTGVMINTGAGPNHDPIVIPYTGAIADATAAKNIPIFVQKNGVWEELTAEKGEPACKLAVGTDFEILPERSSIKNDYPLFIQWATDNSFTSRWWAQTVEAE